MSSARLRIGLAGAGWVTQHHLRAWTALRERATVVAIADPDIAAVQARAAEFGIPAVYASVDEMLDRERLDALDVAAPREHHAPICRLAAEHGIDILCQKPLAPTLAEAKSLVADIGDRVRLMVHENWRFRPHYRRIREWIGGNSIGDIRTVMMFVLTSGLLPDSTGRLPALARQPMLAGLDRMLVMEILIHHVDTLRFLLGPLILASARLGKDCDAIRGEDCATLLLEDTNGAAVALIGDFMAHGYPAQQSDQLEIFGTRGSIHLWSHALQLRGPAPQDVPLDLATAYRESYRAAIQHFIDRLGDGLPFETRPEDNLETLSIVEQAYELGGWRPGR